MIFFRYSKYNGQIMELTNDYYGFNFEQQDSALFLESFLLYYGSFHNNIFIKHFTRDEKQQLKLQPFSGFHVCCRELCNLSLIFAIERTIYHIQRLREAISTVERLFYSKAEYSRTLFQYISLHKMSLLGSHEEAKP